MVIDDVYVFDGRRNSLGKVVVGECRDTFVNLNIIRCDNINKQNVMFLLI